jgi:F-type H+-transporting ATPase subunit g
MIPQVTYYSRVGLELGKIIYESRKMSPPSLATFQSYWQPLINAVRRPSTALTGNSAIVEAMKPSVALGRLRSLNREQLTSAGIVAAEVIGFFTVGEMIGRMKIVGYRSIDHHVEE